MVGHVFSTPDDKGVLRSPGNVMSVTHMQGNVFCSLVTGLHCTA